MKVGFPVEGLHQGLPAEQQPPTTSFNLGNVRPFDVTEERVRGGQRPGITKAYSTQISGAAHPVVAIFQIVTTYIPPEE